MRFAVVLVGFVLAVSVGHAWGAGQATRVQPVPPTVISGADVGFRMEGRKGATPVGRLVVRIDGEWVEAEFAPGLKLITR
jgi:hypothetical protein